MTSEEKSELLREIDKRIALAMNIVLNGQAAEATKDTESIDAMFPGMARILNRPSVKPYGFHSLAPDGTLSVCARVGSHFGSRYVIGHRDANRPAIQSGEATIYNIVGYEMRIELGAITLRKGDQVFTAVVGEPLAEILSSMLDAIATHTHLVNGVVTSGPGTGGAVVGTTPPPVNAADFTSLKAEVEAGAILAEDGGAF